MALALRIRPRAFLISQLYFSSHRILSHRSALYQKFAARGTLKWRASYCCDWSAIRIDFQKCPLMKQTNQSDIGQLASLRPRVTDSRIASRRTALKKLSNAKIDCCRVKQLL
jgi:hypothetical protein